MKMEIKKPALIKNLYREGFRKEFIFNSVSFSILIVSLSIGSVLEYRFYPGTDISYLVYIGLGTVIAVVSLLILPSWNMILKLIIASWAAMFFFLSPGYSILFGFISLGLLVAPSFQIAREWEKAVVFRLGKFKRLRGPGPFVIFPLIDTVVQYVDTRIRATDFRAEMTLTKDTVPTNVDAIAFWMVWDPKKAVLEVENFTEAVILASQAALRDSIGCNDLAVLLSERERLGREIQQILDAKTNPWGITIISIEISDIIIPKELEDAMSKQAQAEREKKSRVILGAAEIEIAEKFAKASEQYRDNPTALHLRAMNMIFEGLKKQGSVILLPSSAVETMSLGTVLGSAMFGSSRLNSSKSAHSELSDNEGERSMINGKG